MDLRARALFGAIALSLCLAGCGGGSSSGGGNNVNPPPPGNGSVTISPTSLTFSGAGAASQQFTVSSTVPGISAPQIDPVGCAPVVSIATTSTTLPATYTVTPTGNGTCSFVVNVGHQSAAIGITVGGGGASPVNGSASQITLTLGGGPGSFTATASSGTLTPDATACSGIVQVNGAGGASPQTFTLVPLAAGSCTFIVVDGASSVSVPITVNTPSGSAAVFVSPSSMTFATRSAAAQTGTLSNTGQVGQVTINEDECIGVASPPGAKIAYVTVNGTTLPTTFTVTPYGPSFQSGTCRIFFNPQNGTPATLTVTVNP
jgi:hypothetical protein